MTILSLGMAPKIYLDSKDAERIIKLCCTAAKIKETHYQGANMINSQRSTAEAPPESNRDQPGLETGPFSAFAAFMHEGVERLAEIQRFTVDIAARQTNDTIKFWKNAYKVQPEGPLGSFLDLASQSTERLAHTQKGVLDLLVQQSANVLDASKTRSESFSKYTKSATDMINATTDRVVAAQKLLLDFAAGQNKAVADAVKQQSGVAGSPAAVEVVETVQRNFEAAIQAQKEVVQAAAKPLKASAASPAA
jgi:hypothetical protein